MWTHHAFLLFVSLPLLAISRDGGEEACKSEHFLLIQEKCRARNDALLQAEKNHDDAKICTSLFKLWRCVARHVPVCFHKVTEIYKMYLHSPHNCILTRQQLHILQNLTLTSANKHNNDSNGGDVSSTTAGPAVESSTSSPTSSLSSSSSSLLVTVEEGSGDGGEELENGTYIIVTPGREDRNNSHHKHTGNDASLCCHSTFTTVTSLWLVAWLVTSSFLHS